MVSFELDEEQRGLQNLARDFARKVVRPGILEREAIPDPRERFPWDIVEEASKVGLRTAAVPREYGGVGADALTLCLFCEELAWGDLGVAVILDQTWKYTRMLYALCNEDQKQRFLVPFVNDKRGLLAIGGTEPDAGSDTWFPYDEPGAGSRTFARRDGDCYVLNGAKHFISNGPDASLYTILARTDPTLRYSEGGLSAFLVTPGTPGFSIGTIHSKIGQRLVNNSELIFQDCRVPARDRLCEEGQFFPALARVMWGSNVEAGATTLGVARAAYEDTLEWARTRVQGGSPIIEHKNIGVMLADMAIQIEAARDITWKAAWAVDHMKPPDTKLPKMAKIFTSEAAFHVCRLAMEIHGGYGSMTDLPIQKYLRDASTFLHSDGTNQIMRLQIQRALQEELGG